MVFNYGVNLEMWNIADFASELKSAELIPSRQILKENIDKYFEIIKNKNILNVKELFERIKTQEKMAVFSEETHIPLDYLEILKREVSSYQPKPIILSDIPEVNPDFIERLSIAGIKNTKQLYEKILSKEEREKLSVITGIGYSDIVEFAKMADISRIRWVGPLFVRIIIVTGIDTVERIINTSPALFFDKINEAIKNKNYKNANNITVGDIGRCVEYAKKLEIGLKL